MRKPRRDLWSARSAGFWSPFGPGKAPSAVPRSSGPRCIGRLATTHGVAITLLSVGTRGDRAQVNEFLDRSGAAVRPQHGRQSANHRVDEPGAGGDHRGAAGLRPGGARCHRDGLDCRSPLWRSRRRDRPPGTRLVADGEGRADPARVAASSHRPAHRRDHGLATGRRTGVCGRRTRRDGDCGPRRAEGNERGDSRHVR